MYPSSFFPRVNLLLKNPSKVNVQVKYIITINLNRKTFEAFLGPQIGTDLYQQKTEMYEMELIKWTVDISDCAVTVSGLSVMIL